MSDVCRLFGQCSEFQWWYLIILEHLHYLRRKRVTKRMGTRNTERLSNFIRRLLVSNYWWKPLLKNPHIKLILKFSLLGTLINWLPCNFLDLEPSNAAFYANRSAALMMVEEFNKALEDARKAFNLDNKFIKAYLRAAKCYIATGQTNNAMMTLQKAQTLEPTNKSVLNEVSQWSQNPIIFLNWFSIFLLIDYLKSK